MAEWQSGYAAACKAVYAGSIPTSASNPDARVVKLVDTTDLKSVASKTGVPVRFRFRAPHYKKRSLFGLFFLRLILSNAVNQAFEHE